MLGMTSKYATSQKKMLHNLLCTTCDMIKNLQKILKISPVSKQRVKTHNEQRLTSRSFISGHGCWMQLKIDNCIPINRLRDMNIHPVLVNWVIINLLPSRCEDN